MKALKLGKSLWILLFFNNIVIQAIAQNHMFLGTNLDFQAHVKGIFSNVNKVIGLLRMLHHILPRLRLFTICKSFIRPHLDYGNVIYAQIYNTYRDTYRDTYYYTYMFHQILESI